MSERRAQTGRRLGVGALMALVAGTGLGIWLVIDDVRAEFGDVEPRLGELDFRGWAQLIFLVVVGVLGGLSLVGPVLLLALRRREGRRRWGPGRIWWFSQGMASWLLWPPVIYRRAQGENFARSAAGTCWAYGTPLMAVYVGSALLAGRWIGRRRRRRPTTWHERFGLILGLLWACTGLYVLFMLYRDSFFDR